jgi:glycosyltransferase involved in cell wall biosynthesis
MLITNKPYCVYVENGLAIYNYDLKISRNPIAKILFWYLVRSANLKKLIFMSEAGKKSFISSSKYSKKTIDIINSKSIVCYPLIENDDAANKKFNGKINILFAGMFYVKGGLESVNAIKKLEKRYKNIKLTIVTPIHSIKKVDLDYISSIKSITLLDAKFNTQEMKNIFKKHDIFLLPTYRDSFGLVLIEALSVGMPIVCTDQYALKEMAINNYNGFVIPNHPLRDYNPDTLKLYGKYYNPKDFYSDLFEFQKKGKMKEIEKFIYNSIEKFILKPKLIEKFSKNSLELYDKKFHYQLISDKIESVFLEAIKK